VVVGMLAVGWLTARLERRATATRWRTGGDLLVALIGGFTIIIMRGSLGGIIAWIGPPILAAVMVTALLDPQRRAAAPQPDGDREEPRGDWRARFAAARVKSDRRAHGTPSSPK